MTTKILNKLETLFKAAHWNTIEITMKSTGLKIALTPYFDDYGEEPDPRDMEHCAFITGCGQQDAIWYTGKPRSVARDLANHDEIHARWMKQAVELARMSDEARGDWSDDAWSYYSDMYKDVFGHRPTRYPDERYMIAEILDSDVVSTTEAHSLQDAIEMANELLIYQCNGHGRCLEEFCGHDCHKANEDEPQAWLHADKSKWDAHILKIS